jgi:hypothetical protein
MIIIIKTFKAFNRTYELVLSIHSNNGLISENSMNRFVTEIAVVQMDLYVLDHKTT